MRRHLWTCDTPAGRLGVVRIGVWFVAVSADGGIRGRRLSCSRAQRLLERAVAR